MSVPARTRRSAMAPYSIGRASLPVRREKYGGVKIGSAFFGFLTATGMVVLLTALAVAAGAVLSLAIDTDPGQAAREATQSAGTVGIVGGVVLLVILFAAYYC